MNVSSLRKSNLLFYIYTPRWVETSAGIKVLHKLCSDLNHIGHEAYLVLSENGINGEPRVDGSLFTPILNKELLIAHKKAGREPIVVYSETIVGNPLQGKYVIRYLLNYITLLGGPRSYSENDFILAYTKDIARDFFEKTKRNARILFLPVIKPEDFIYRTSKKDYWLLYVGKIREYADIDNVSNIETLKAQLKSDIFVVSRSGSNRIERKLLVEKLSEAKGVIVFENSAVILESILSGGIAIVMPHILSRPIIGEEEIGLYGIATSIDQDEITRAFNTKYLAREKYLDIYNQYYSNLLNLIPELIEYTNNKFHETSYQIKIPNTFYFFNKNRVLLAFSIIRKRGLIVFWKTLVTFISRRYSRNLFLGKNK